MKFEAGEEPANPSQSAWKRTWFPICWRDMTNKNMGKFLGAKARARLRTRRRDLRGGYEQHSATTGIHGTGRGLCQESEQPVSREGEKIEFQSHDL